MNQEESKKIDEKMEKWITPDRKKLMFWTQVALVVGVFIYAFVVVFF